MGAMHEMLVLDPTGHSSVEWDPQRPAEVENARTQYDKFIGLGYRVFYGDGRGDDGKGDPMRSFDPRAEKMLLTPPVAGG